MKYSTITNDETESMPIYLNLNIIAQTSTATSFTVKISAFGGDCDDESGKLIVTNSLNSEKLTDSVTINDNLISLQCSGIPLEYKVTVTNNLESSSGITLKYSTISDGGTVDLNSNTISQTSTATSFTVKIYAIGGDCGSGKEIATADLTSTQTTKTITINSETISTKCPHIPSQSDCLAGTYFNSASSTCLPCEKGTYQNEGGQSSCNKCGSGYTTESSGSTSKDDCKQIYHIFCGDESGALCQYSDVANYQKNQLQSCCANSDCVLEENSKIVIFLNSYNNDLEIDVNKLKGQEIIIKTSSDGVKQLSSANLKITSTTTLTGKSQSNELKGAAGNIQIPTKYTENLIVAFNEKLTIMQDSDASTQSTPIKLETQGKTTEIVIDNSVNDEKQAFTITLLLLLL